MEEYSGMFFRKKLLDFSVNIAVKQPGY